MSAAAPTLGPGIRAVLLDLDGVVTDTASLHAAAWKRLFDDLLAELAGPGGRFEPFRVPEDYVAHVDGRPRLEGIRTFLEARGIDLPEGRADDPPEARTVNGLGRRKNGYFNAALEQEGVPVFATSIAFIRRQRDQARRTACVSSSRNCRPVLAQAGLMRLFDVVVDGTDIAREGLHGKPAPDAFLRAASLLGVAPGEAAVVEDAVSGVASGRAGGFACVIEIDRGAGKEALLAAGADLVVDDLDTIVSS